MTESIVDFEHHALVEYTVVGCMDVTAVVRMTLVAEVAEDRESCSGICMDLKWAPMVSARKIACLYAVSMEAAEERCMVKDG